MKRRLLGIVLALAFPCLVWAALPFTDTFTGTDATELGTYSASWTVPLVTGNLLINTNAVRPAVAAAYPYDWGTAYNNSETYGNDQYAQAVVTWTGTTAYVGVGVRIDANGAGYACVYEPQNGQAGIFLINYSAGNGLSGSNLALDGVTWSTGDTMRCEAEGTTIRMKRNGSQTASATDATYSAGKAGLAATQSSTTERMDTFEGGNITSTDQTFGFRLRLNQ